MTITKEGALASFYTVNKAPIKHLRVYFSPKQAGSGDPTPSNVREISGRTGLNVTHCGINLLQCSMNLNSASKGITYTEYRNSNGEVEKITAIGTATDELCFRNLNYEANKYKWVPDGAYATYASENATTIFTGDAYTLTDKTGTKGYNLTTGGWHYWNVVNNSNNSHELIRIQLTPRYCKDISFNETIYPMVVLEQDAGCAFEPYSGTTIPINWSSEAGTLYGGYIDLITGELVQTHYGMYVNRNTIPHLNLGDITETYTQAWFLNSTDNIPRFKLYTGLSNRFKCLKSSKAVVNGFINFSGNTYFMIPSSDLTTKDIAGILDWFDANPTFYVAELYTPISYQLSPTQFSTLIGRNNIWSDADRVEVEYDLAESNDELYKRRNILLRSVPHIETASGNIINFQTDVVAPMKSAKINFSPIQEGSGTPSPTNIRPISGWTNLSLYHSGENLYVPNSNNKGYISKSGVITVDETSTYTDLIPVNLGDVYSFECTTVSVNGDTNRRIHGYNSSGTWVQQLTSGTTAANTVEYRKISATIPAGISYIRVSFRNQDTNVRIAKEDISTVTQTDPLYNGELNLTTGQLIIHYKLCTITGTESNLSYNWDGLLLPVADSISDNQTIGIIACSHTNNFVRGGAFWSSARTTTNLTITDNPVCAACSQGSQLRFRKRDLDPEYTRNIELYRNWLKEQNSLGTPLQIVYKLIEPVTYQLSPQTIRTFSGINNIWSNTNDQISISYWTH